MGQDEDRKNHERMQGLIEAARQDQVLQEADRGGRGDRCSQPCQVQAGSGQLDREHRARRPERASVGQDPRTCPQLFNRTDVNNDLSNKPQPSQGKTLKTALRNIVVYIIYLSVVSLSISNNFLSNGTALVCLTLTK